MTIFIASLAVALCMSFFCSLVEPGTPVSDILKAFVEQHVHIAIVRDPANRCLGLITMEDIIEELVGDIQDEFDRLPRHVHSLSGGTWMFGGGVPVGDVIAKLGGAPVPAGGSLAAWLARQLNQPPKPGQVVCHDGLEFVVRRVRRGRIFEASAGTKSQS